MQYDLGNVNLALIDQALMELGSQVCKPVGPVCLECPFQSGCKAYAEVCTAKKAEVG
jgi:A/G-specific adenine glycosylase